MRPGRTERSGQQRTAMERHRTGSLTNSECAEKIGGVSGTVVVVVYGGK